VLLSLFRLRRKGFAPPSTERVVADLGHGQLLDARSCRVGTAHHSDPLKLAYQQGYERGYRDGFAKRRERDAILVIDEPGNEAIKEAWTAGWMARKALMEDETAD
jgi:hypothetical protein